MTSVNILHLHLYNIPTKKQSTPSMTSQSCSVELRTDHPATTWTWQAAVSEPWCKHYSSALHLRRRTSFFLLRVGRTFVAACRGMLVLRTRTHWISSHKTAAFDENAAVREGKRACLLSFCGIRFQASVASSCYSTQCKHPHSHGAAARNNEGQTSLLVLFEL